METVHTQLAPPSTLATGNQPATQQSEHQHQQADNQHPKAQPSNGRSPGDGPAQNASRAGDANSAGVLQRAVDVAWPGTSPEAQVRRAVAHVLAQTIEGADGPHTLLMARCGEFVRKREPAGVAALPPGTRIMTVIANDTSGLLSVTQGRFDKVIRLDLPALLAAAGENGTATAAAVGSGGSSARAGGKGSDSTGAGPPNNGTAAAQRQTLQHRLRELFPPVPDDTAAAKRNAAMRATASLLLTLAQPPDAPPGLPPYATVTRVLGVHLRSQKHLDWPGSLGVLLATRPDVFEVGGFGKGDTLVKLADPESLLSYQPFLEQQPQQRQGAAEATNGTPSAGFAASPAKAAAHAVAPPAATAAPAGPLPTATAADVPMPALVPAARPAAANHQASTAATAASTSGAAVCAAFNTLLGQLLPDDVSDFEAKREAARILACAPASRGVPPCAMLTLDIGKSLKAQCVGYSAPKLKDLFSQQPGLFEVRTAGCHALCRLVHPRLLALAPARAAAVDSLLLELLPDSRDGKGDPEAARAVARALGAAKGDKDGGVPPHAMLTVQLGAELKAQGVTFSGKLKDILAAHPDVFSVTSGGGHALVRLVHPGLLEAFGGSKPRAADPDRQPAAAGTSGSSGRPVASQAAAAANGASGRPSAPATAAAPSAPRPAADADFRGLPLGPPRVDLPFTPGKDIDHMTFVAVTSAWPGKSGASRVRSIAARTLHAARHGPLGPMSMLLSKLHKQVLSLSTYLVKELAVRAMIAQPEGLLELLLARSSLGVFESQEHANADAGGGEAGAPEAAVRLRMAAVRQASPAGIAAAINGAYPVGAGGPVGRVLRVCADRLARQAEDPEAPGFTTLPLAQLLQTASAREPLALAAAARERGGGVSAALLGALLNSDERKLMAAWRSPSASGVAVAGLQLANLVRKWPAASESEADGELGAAVARPGRPAPAQTIAQPSADAGASDWPTDAPETAAHEYDAHAYGPHPPSADALEATPAVADTYGAAAGHPAQNGSSSPGAVLLHSLPSPMPIPIPTPSGLDDGSGAAAAPLAASLQAGSAMLPPAATVVIDVPCNVEHLGMLQHCYSCARIGLAVKAAAGAPALVALYAPAAAFCAGGAVGSGAPMDHSWPATVYVVDAVGDNGAVLLESLRSLLEERGVAKAVHGSRQVLGPLRCALGPGLRVGPLLDTLVPLSLISVALGGEPLAAQPAVAEGLQGGFAAMSAITSQVAALKARLAACDGLWQEWARVEVLGALGSKQWDWLAGRVQAESGKDSTWLVRPLGDSQLKVAVQAVQHLPELWQLLCDALPAAALAASTRLETE